MILLQKHKILISLCLYFILVYGSRLFLTYFPISSEFWNFIIFYGRHFVFLMFLGIFYRQDFIIDWKKFTKSLLKNSGQIVVFYFVFFAIVLITSHIPILNQIKVAPTINLVDGGILGKVVSIITTGIIGPINEEFVFRKIIIGEGKTYFSEKACLIVSSILFGLIHIFSIYDLLSSIVFILAGLFLGFIYIKKQNIIFTTGTHILNNSIVNLIELFIK